MIKIPVTETSIVALPSVRKMGVKGDGVTDDTGAIQEALAASPALLFPAGRYVVAGKLQVSGKAIRLVFQKGAVLVDPNNLEALLELDHCDGAHIHGAVFEGTDEGPSCGSAVAERCFIRVIRSDFVRLEHIAGSKKQTLLALSGCSGCLIADWEHDGFMPGVGEEVPGARFCPAVFVEGGKGNLIVNGSVNNHGSAVLTGYWKTPAEPVAEALRTPTGTVITAITGRNLKDNGIYVSTGEATTISHCDFEDVAGSGVKARGSFNTIAHCTVTRAGTGITVTGVGKVGPNDHGNKVLNNTIRGAGNVSIYATDYDEKYPNIYQYDLLIAGNVIEDHRGGEKNDKEAIRAICTSGLLIAGNTITGAESTDWAVTANGPCIAAPCFGFLFANNTIDRSAGGGAKIEHVHDGTISGNHGAGNKNCLIKASSLTNCTISGNTCLDQPVLELSGRVEKVPPEKVLVGGPVKKVTVGDNRGAVKIDDAARAGCELL